MFKKKEPNFANNACDYVDKYFDKLNEKVIDLAFELAKERNIPTVDLNLMKECIGKIMVIHEELVVQKVMTDSYSSKISENSIKASIKIIKASGCEYVAHHSFSLTEGGCLSGPDEYWVEFTVKGTKKNIQALDKVII